MAMEIEAKMKVEDHAAVRERLHECGAEHIGEYLETNIFFDTPGRSLLVADQGLRLRQKRDLATHGESFFLTFKGATQASELKLREEVEIQVSSGRDAAELLRRLGFVQTLAFDKRRQSWKLDDCTIELDELPYLGTFVEIEGPGEPNVMRAREKLAMAARPLIRSSYTVLLMSHLEEHGWPGGPVVTFEASP